MKGPGGVSVQDCMAARRQRAGAQPWCGGTAGLSAGTRHSQEFPDVEVGRGLVLESRFRCPCQEGRYPDVGCPDVQVS